MTQPLVSIVIPIYNVGQWLPKCLMSCVNQTYEKIEIIAVNDGSTDDSKETIHRFQEKDKRVKLVDKPNGGLNSARKAGIDFATGEFITILDGDDFFELNAIEIFITHFDDQRIDIVIGNGRQVLHNTGRVIGEVFTGGKRILTGEEYISDILNHGYNTTCMKLYRSTLIKNETIFPDLLAIEDLPVSIQWAYKVREVIYVPIIVYNYVRARPGALTFKNRRKIVEGGFDAVYFTFKFMVNGEKFKIVEKSFVNFLCLKIYMYLYNSENDLNRNKKRIKEMTSFVRERRKLVCGKQFRFLVLLVEVNIMMGHYFVALMQRIKPTFSKGTKTYI